ncbi:hypothetical protein F404_gp011 [Vibrio phage pVp-1]|uniref:Uncharacterized protein n=1 Tax=Vibrio phage pVp-1 TaxID=1150989 RepID=H6WXA2_9CAUD|nr:hypothetical protein F404_gp011 [Vibrio phage pVp-1]AFB83868.1 hypothetical protein pVp-1_0011 [Vibrio phage pVp-1]QQO38489.1 hypothetical protein VPG01_131 [Vibrio phage VPG01]
MNKVESYKIEGSIPEGMRSVGFYVTQEHIEEVGKGLKIYRDFDMCYFNKYACTRAKLDEPATLHDSPWVDATLVDPDTFDLQGIEVVFGDEMQLPKGYKVYWISIQPNEELKVVYAIGDKSDREGEWFAPQS